MVSSKNHWVRYQSKIRNVIEYIHANLCSDLSSDVLADVAHLSVYHWHRIYRAITGESAASTVKRCRMQKAAARLLRSDDSVADIGVSVGIGDVHSFTRMFKEYYGIAPGQFRTANQKLYTDNHVNVVKDVLATDNTEEKSVRIESLAETHLLGMWHHGDYMEIGQSFEKSMALCSMYNLLTDVPQTIGVYHGDPEIIELERQRSFAGIVIDTSAKPPAELESYSRPAGLYAVLTHRGPYATLTQSYNWLYGTWLPAFGALLRDSPCCENYLNSPISTKPDELLTEICLPLE